MKKWNRFVLATSPVVILLCLVSVAQAGTPAVVNVVDFGANGSDALDDTAAIQNAVDSVASNATIYFPGGTYLIKASDSEGVDVVSKTRLSFCGDGAVIKRKSDATSVCRWITFKDSNYITIRDLTFDAAGLTSSGGLRFLGCNNVRVESSNFIDSAFNSSITDDRYAVVTEPDATYGGSENVWITDNHFSKLQVETRSSKVVFSRNTMESPVRRGFRIGVNSSNLMVTDVVCSNNMILTAGYGSAIAVVIDPISSYNGVLSDVIIANNNIVAGAWNSSALIYIGGTGTTSNTFRNFQIVNNNIYDHAANPAVVVDYASPSVRFTGSRISGNAYNNDSTAVSWPFQLNYLRNSIVAENVLTGNIAYGMAVGSPEKTQVVNNQVESTTRGYQLQAAPGTSIASYGDNTIRGNRAYGTGDDWVISDTNGTRDLVIGDETRVNTSAINGSSNILEVRGRLIVKTNNTSDTTITTFGGGYSGQVVTLIFGDARTTLNNSVNLRLVTSPFISTVNDTMRFIFDGTYWSETSRTAIP